jgi:hypothetical protein
MTVFYEVHFYSNSRIKESLKNSGFQWYIIEFGESSRLIVCGIILDLEPENIKKIYYFKYQWENKSKILRFIPYKLKDRNNSYSYNIVNQITGFMILLGSHNKHKITFNPSIDPELIIERFRDGTTVIIS